MCVNGERSNQLNDDQSFQPETSLRWFILSSLLLCCDKFKGTLGSMGMLESIRLEIRPPEPVSVHRHRYLQQPVNALFSMRMPNMIITVFEEIDF